MLNLFKKPKPILVVRASALFDEDGIIKLKKEIGSSYTLIVANETNDVKIVTPDLEEAGDGKASFLGSGSAEEFEEQKKKDDGMDKWYKRLMKL